jgi:O-succinylbenzoic acid--CoA ligase
MITPSVPCPWAVQARRRPQDPALIRADGSVITWSGLDAQALQLQASLPGPADRPLLHIPGRTADDVVRLVAALRAGRDLLLLAPRLPEPEVESMARRLQAVRFTAQPAGTPAAPTEALSGGTLILTSGSTGDPRWIRHAVAAHVVSATAVTAALDLRAGDRWLWSLPMHHVGGLSILFRCALAGAALVLPTEAFWPLPEGITHVSLVPTQLQGALEAGTRPPASLREVVLGGAAMPGPLLQQAVAAGWPVRTSYGMTETASMVTLSARWQPPIPETPHAGSALAHADVDIDRGRIVVRTPALADGVADMDGFFATADAGTLDARGHLSVHGRLDRVIISGGENLDPVRIEQAIRALPGVSTVTVVGVPDEKWGERPVAFVAMKDGSPPDPESLRAALAPVLEPYAIPDRVLPFPPPLPGQLKVRQADLVAAALAIREE